MVQDYATYTLLFEANSKSWRDMAHHWPAAPTFSMGGQDTSNRGTSELGEVGVPIGVLCYCAVLIYPMGTQQVKIPTRCGYSFVTTAYKGVGMVLVYPAHTLPMDILN